MKQFLYIIICVLFCSCSNNIQEIPATITPCKSIPVGRASAIAWSINGKGYIFGGRDSNNILHKDLWIYDPQLDSWQNLENTPLTARVKGTACVVGDKVYIGLGFQRGLHQSSSYLQDWWEYTPTTDEWRRLQDFPNKNTIGVVSYVKENKIYCVHGSGGNGFTADIVVYDIKNNQWEMIDRTNRIDRISMAGAGNSLQGRYYYGSGYNTSNMNEWYEIHFDGKWNLCAYVPGGREFAICVKTDKFLYLVGGRKFGGTLTDGKLYNDILRYDIHTDQWTLAGITNEEAENRFGFTIGKTAYIGGGENNSGILHTLYKIED